MTGSRPVAPIGRFASLRTFAGQSRDFDHAFAGNDQVCADVRAPFSFVRVLQSERRLADVWAGMIMGAGPWSEHFGQVSASHKFHPQKCVDWTARVVTRTMFG